MAALLTQRLCGWYLDVATGAADALTHPYPHHHTRAPGAAGAGAGAAAEQHDDLYFAQQLLPQENVAVLPGSAFSAPGFCRVVITPPLDVLRVAFDRMRAFVQRNYPGAGSSNSS